MDDLDAIRHEWLVQCGSCDYGLPEYGCNCPKGDHRPVIQQLIDEVERLRMAAGVYGQFAKVASRWRAQFAAEINDNNEALFTPNELRLIRAIEDIGKMALRWDDGRLAFIQTPDGDVL